MTGNSSQFKQQMLVRALKGAKAAGIDVTRVEIDPVGKIVLCIKSEPGEPLSALKKWKQDHGAS